MTGGMAEGRDEACIEFEKDRMCDIGSGIVCM